MRSWGLAASAYVMAAVLVITPVMDVTVSALPFRFDDPVWRFATIGIYAEGVMTALLGLFLALVAAAYFGHRGMLRALVLVNVLGALCFAAVIGSFILEATTMRTLVAEEVQGAFGVASVGALVKHACGLLGTVVMALAARAESRHRPSRPKGSGPKAVAVGGRKAR